jgi:NhaA family Na+:H+ antiporter
MLLANSPWAAAFRDFWEIHFRLGIGRFNLDEPLHFWINDALMALFFFVVGLEIKRELVDGELSTAPKAAFPVIAALGGMLVPAGIYLALQLGRPGERGWGIPMATDIAFVVGVLALFGRRVPFGLKVFLVSLAIADDVGAILVIALAYSGSPDWIALILAACGFGLVYGLNRLGVRPILPYVIVGAAIWLAVLKSGIHPTIAGVLLGLLTPSSAWVQPPTLRDAIADVSLRMSSEERAVEPDDYRRLALAARESSSPLVRLETALHPWVSFGIMPLFALANAGVEFRLASLTDPVAWAIVLGLVVGKPVGILAFSYTAVRLGLARLPSAVSWGHVAGAACLGGIGFTMSIFIAGLAFQNGLLESAKAGILVGTLASALLGSAMLRLALVRRA